MAEETQRKTQSLPLVEFEVKILTSVQSRFGHVLLADILHCKMNWFRGEACRLEKVRESQTGSWKVMCDCSLSFLQP